MSGRQRGQGGRGGRRTLVRAMACGGRALAGCDGRRGREVVVGRRGAMRGGLRPLSAHSPSFPSRSDRLFPTLETNRLEAHSNPELPDPSPAPCPPGPRPVPPAAHTQSKTPRRRRHPRRTARCRAQLARRLHAHLRARIGASRAPRLQTTPPHTIFERPTAFSSSRRCCKPKSSAPWTPQRC